ncbi:hypothetical protein SCHPADRAFT_896870 [Schizopora paradoxa]|uniref:Uncharacterized protein n=1 Tax=Schizopora paradoxa TaxID=27342 RepID=A0A0H2QYJ5_9AGAM|nr:hypothetical protein SCHPADRAFT_896870 [Schizopora paradoxa]
MEDIRCEWNLFPHGCGIARPSLASDQNQRLSGPEYPRGRCTAQVPGLHPIFLPRLLPYYSYHDVPPDDNTMAPRWKTLIGNWRRGRRQLGGAEAPVLPLHSTPMLDAMTFATAQDPDVAAEILEGNEPHDRNVPMYMQVRSRLPPEILQSSVHERPDDVPLGDRRRSPMPTATGTAVSTSYSPPGTLLRSRAHPQEPVRGGNFHSHSETMHVGSELGFRNAEAQRNLSLNFSLNMRLDQGNIIDWQMQNSLRVHCTALFAARNNGFE